MGRLRLVLALLAAVGLLGVVGAVAVVVNLRSTAEHAWAELDKVADPDGRVVAVDVDPDGTLWRLTEGRGCHGCEVLWWRTPEATWEALGGVPSGRLGVSRLEVSDDGLVLAAGEGLWASDDGGLRWAEQVDGQPGMQVSAAIQGGYVLAHLGNDELGGWAVRAPVDDGDFTEEWEPLPLPLPTTTYAGSLLAVGDVLVAQNPMLGVDADIAFVSRDQGETWARLDLPCWTTWLQAGPRRLFAFCNIGRASMRVMRGDPEAGTWERFVTIPTRGVASGLGRPEALSDDLVLGEVTSGLRSGPGLLAQDRILRTTLPAEVEDHAVASDGTTFVVARGRLLRSSGQSGTWRPLR
ncbi:hypothetical protein [Nocardioides bigeumensis]|uniref:Exo-alpha-sialidase n=1 Tax=Nocardioides bigeumensis TaxID=433657 RepID=A0ABN2Y384_9ACTN